MSRLSGGTTFISGTSAAARDLHFVSFRVGEWEYAVEVADVCGIYHGLAIIPTPDEPEIISGEVHLAAQRVPVVDLRNLLHLPDRIGTGWLLVVRQSGGMLGVLVDHVSEVIRVSPGALEPAGDDPLEPSAPGIITAVAHHRGRRIHIPDLPRIFREYSAW